MELICINWDTIIENSISGLIVGGILGYLGYMIWKKQHLYSKKLDAYIKLIPFLHHLVATTLLIRNENNVNEKEFADKLYFEILPAVETFDFYFADDYEYKYNGLFKQLSDIFFDIKERKINMTEEELSQEISPIMKEFTDVKKKLKTKCFLSFHHTKVTPP